MNNRDKNKKTVSRRDFLKTIGAAGMAATGLSACAGGEEKTAAAVAEPTGEMTYRTSPSTGDRVSLLGFGMMRLPSVGGRSAREGNEEIDQEMVNELVDYAIAHGVNYFDTSPAYCRGKSEHATGIALSRHPRDSYFIATKLSNFAPATWSREASVAMYCNSMKELQVDYLDYLLLHGVGMGVGMGGGMEEFESRYMKNGILDFLLEERKAGRIRNLGFSYHGDVRVFDYLLSRHDEYKWDFVQIQLNYLDWEVRQANQPEEHRCRVPVQRAGEAGHSCHHHGTAAGRPSFQCAQHHFCPPQAARTRDERGFVGVPFCRKPARCPHRAERHDAHGALAGQPAHVFSPEAADGRRFRVPARNRHADDEL